MITDLKSTQDASPDGFSYDVFKYAYFQQAGFYAMGHQVLTGDDPCFAIFAIEKEEPFVHTSFELGVKTIEAGKNAARKSLAIYKQCKESGVWPMFSDKILTLDMPLFALQKHGINPYQV
ncbi:MAG: PD-(D/E)XK nuclease-like domain-containing protein [Planctomycetes bacterium]|nr:PD-(D/E)XK nuclease-like domain-containing protein [Planctomycetota bacterium]